MLVRRGLRWLVVLGVRRSLFGIAPVPVRRSWDYLAVEKDSGLLEILDRLRSDLEFDFVVVDNWDADLLSAGIARPSDPQHLVYVYVSVFGHGISFACERSSTSPGLPYDSDGMVDGVEYADLLAAVQQHLAPSEATDA
jgi:hypothetical protein